MQQHLLDTFTEFTPGAASPYKVTFQLKDKILSYIVLMKLHLNNYSMDPAEVIGDLKCSTTKLCSIARECGARVETKRQDGGSKKKIVLALPLMFPTRTRV